MKVFRVYNIVTANWWLGIASMLFLIISCNSGDQSSGHEISVDLSSYQVKSGWSLQSVAAEPQVIAPVDLIFDHMGRMWVVEMTGYMTDFTGSREDESIGRISILEDKDGNGMTDHKKVFLDGLVLPRSIAFAQGGLLYAEPPNLWWVPIEAGDQPGKRELVDSAYAVGGNVEHQPNGLMYGLDNWYYNAKSNARYRYRNRKWEKDFIFGRGQWGISQDEYGRLYYNNNSNQFQGDYFLPGILDQNKNLSYPPGISMTIVKDQNVYPLQFTAVNRGYVEGVLDSVTHRLRHFTSASGPLYYTGNRYGGALANNALVCGPEVNLIKRNVINPNDIRTTGTQYYEDSEWIISLDQAFRPVSLRLGPDGLVYILDMHRGIIQHKTYMTNYLRRQYEEAGLDTISNMGRILRVQPEDADPEAIPAMGSDPDLIELLQHPNSWQRLYAQRQIVENHRMDLVPALKELLEMVGLADYVPLHAFWALEGLDALDQEQVIDFAVRDDGYYFPHVVKYLAQARTDQFPVLESKLTASGFQWNEINEIYRAVATSHMGPEAGDQARFLHDLLKRIDAENWQFAIYMALSQYEDQEIDLIEPLKKRVADDTELVEWLEDLQQKIQGTKDFLARKTDRVTRDNGLEIFESNCSTCHGRDGKGIENLAPPLYQSPYLEDRDSALVMIALYGLQGPVEIAGQRYEFAGVMPGLAENTEYSDQEIAAVLSFIKNAFSWKPRSVSSRLVGALRDFPPEDGQPFTVESLENHLSQVGTKGNN